MKWAIYSYNSMKNVTTLITSEAVHVEVCSHLHAHASLCEVPSGII